MKILIADDERKIRYSLQSMLEELYPGRHEYLHAADGLELIQLAEQKQPAVAFVDIRMPRMDGLTALERARQRASGTIWVILTGFAEFEYAQKALTLGVREYLLKPVSIEDLSAAMERIGQSGLRQARDENEKFALRVMRAMNYYSLAQAEPMEDDLPGPYALYLIYADGWEHQARHRLLQSLTERLDAFAKSRIAQDTGLQYVLFYPAGENLCLVSRNDPEQRLKWEILRLMKEEMEPFTVFCCGAGTLWELYDEQQRAAERAGIRSVYRFGGIIDCSELEALPGYETLLRFSGKLDRICVAFLSCDEVGYKNALNDFYRDAECRKTFLKVDTNSLSCFLKTSLSVKIQTANFKEFVHSLIASSDDMFSGSGRSSGTDLISSVMNYVQKHYMEQIGVNTISDLFDISPNYLSKIFHERSGQKFIDYLTEVRIATAKRLFTQVPDITVKRVAEEVGYLSTRHFAKTFSKIAGCLPSEYQQRLSKELTENAWVTTD